MTAPGVAGAVQVDLRPLQTGHAFRGIGGYVNAVHRLAGPAVGLVSSRHRLPVGEEGWDYLDVGGLFSGRFGWVADAAAGLSAPLGETVTHLPLPDPGLSRRGRTVVTVHDAIPERFPAWHPAGTVGRARHLAKLRLIKAAGSVIAVSDSTAEDACRFYGVNPARVRVVHLALGPEWRAPSWPGVEHLNLPPRYVVVAGGSGDPDPRKRLQDALPTLLRLPEDMGLVVTGRRGRELAELQRAAAAAGCVGRVFGTGQLPVDELVAVVAGASCLLFPSVWEGFGLPLLEAMTVGVPCVVTDGGALPEVAAGCAEVVPVGDVGAMGEAVLRVVEDAQHASALAARGRARAADFTPDRFATGHRTAYDAA